MNNVIPKSVSDFEKAVRSGQYKKATTILLSILGQILKSNGIIENENNGKVLKKVFERDQTELATSLSNSISSLFLDQKFIISPADFRSLYLGHRALCVIFSASGFGNSDFILRRLGFVPTDEAFKTASMSDLFKFCLLYTNESLIPVDFNLLFRRSPPLACGFAISLLAARFVATPQAFAKRDVLLKWTTEALDQLSSLDGIPIEILIDVWMHCSYADFREKHAIKAPLNRLLRKHMAKAGFQDPELASSDQSKKTVFVFLEWFHKTHSIMRTHSISMQALRQKYRLVGFGPQGTVDDAGKAVFDEFHFFDRFDTSVRFLAPIMDLVKTEKPVAVYYPSVGMGLHSLFLINLLLAKTQLMALGHPATTHSDKIDHVLVEEDYVGDKTLFSENIVTVSKNSLPYFEPNLKDFEPAKRKQRDAIRIAVPSAVMKLNPKFLSACRAVVERAPVKVEFHFMMGGCYGFMYVYTKKAVEEQVPNAVVHPTLPYPAYMKRISACDLFANPFPFGNTNGIVDTVYLGLPGVCWTGDEVHSHIDEGLFRRMDFPEFCIAKTHEDYVEALLRLVSDEDLRNSLKDDLRTRRPDRLLYTGEPKNFLAKFESLVG